MRSSALIVALALMPSILLAQGKSMLLKGKVDDTTVKYVYLDFLERKDNRFDSIMVKNGQFEQRILCDTVTKVSISVEPPLNLANSWTLSGKKVDFSRFYKRVGIDSSDAQKQLRPIFREVMVPAEENKMLLSLKPETSIEVAIPMGGPQLLSIAGDKDLEAYVAFMHRISPLKDEIKKITADYMLYEGKVDVAVIAQYDDQLTAAHRKIRNEAKAFIVNNPRNSYMREVIYGYIYPDMAIINSLITNIDQYYWNTKPGASMKKSLLVSPNKPKVGDSVKDFTARDVNGKMVKLSDVKGKVILVEFWASWCSPCRAENPYLAYMNQRYKDKGFTLVAFSLDQKESDWLGAVKKDGATWLNLSDLNGYKSEIVKEWGIRGIPTNFLIKDGKIIATDVRKHLLNEKLKEVL